MKSDALQFSDNPLFFRKKRLLVGVKLPFKNVLLSDRLLLYDGGTKDRPYDFDSLEKALKYYHRVKNKTLFSSDELQAFKEAILKNKDKYNEVLGRIRWGEDDSVNDSTDDTSEIIVGTDNLESRLQAQEYARILKNHLVSQGLVKPDYVVKIRFYLPESSDHFREYTPLEQKMDSHEAMEIYKDPSFRELLYEYESYQFLFALPPEEIKKALATRYNDDLLIFQIFKAGYSHILDSLAEHLESSVKTGKEESAAGSSSSSSEKKITYQF